MLMAMEKKQKPKEHHEPTGGRREENVGQKKNYKHGFKSQKYIRI